MRPYGIWSSDPAMGLTVSWVRTNRAVHGVMQAKTIAPWVEKQGKRSKRVEIAIFSGSEEFVISLASGDNARGRVAVANDLTRVVCGTKNEKRSTFKTRRAKLSE